MRLEKGEKGNVSGGGGGGGSDQKEGAGKEVNLA